MLINLARPCGVMRACVRLCAGLGRGSSSGKSIEETTKEIDEHYNKVSPSPLAALCTIPCRILWQSTESVGSCRKGMHVVVFGCCGLGEWLDR